MEASTFHAFASVRHKSNSKAKLALVAASRNAPQYVEKKKKRKF
jgi:hypothetical protein